MRGKSATCRQQTLLYHRVFDPHRSETAETKSPRIGKSETCRASEWQSQCAGESYHHHRLGPKAIRPWAVVRKTISCTTTGAALLLFSGPICSLFTGFPSFKLRTIALSVDRGVKSAPSAAVTGRAGTRPGNNWRQRTEPCLNESR